MLNTVNKKKTTYFICLRFTFSVARLGGLLHIIVKKVL